jgi:hypothetical protein
VLGDADSSQLEKARCEIFTDIDLYFFVDSILDTSKLEELKSTGELSIDFEGFPEAVARCCEYRRLFD